MLPKLERIYANSGFRWQSFDSLEAGLHWVREQLPLPH